MTSLDTGVRPKVFRISALFIQNSSMISDFLTDRFSSTGSDLDVEMRVGPESASGASVCLWVGGDLGSAGD